MTKRCMSCGKEYPMDDPSPGVSDGFCPRLVEMEPSECSKIYMEWAYIPKPKQSLRDFYKAKKEAKCETSGALSAV